MPCIEVSAPAHLHAGNFEFTCDEAVSRCFGTIGLAVEAPRLVVRVCTGPRLDAYSLGGRWCEELAPIAKRYLGVLEEELGVRLVAELRRCYPWGAGLGARTALALSLAAAALRLTGEPRSLEDLALLLGRGWVSGLGYHAFTRGGLVVDAGFRPGRLGGRVPPLVARLEPPIHVAIITPLDPLGAVRRLKEAVESRSYPRAPEELSARLARLAFTGFLCNAVAGDYAEAFRALEGMNRLAAEYWRGLGQSGTYCCREAEEAAEHLRRYGAAAVLQSSWGPSVWGVYLRAEDARLAAREAARRLGFRLLAWATRVDTSGARLRNPSPG